MKNKDKTPEKNWTYFYLNGTTLSGHPTRTTMCNSLRSLTYAWYYLEESGIYEPWLLNQKDPSWL